MTDNDRGKENRKNEIIIGIDLGTTNSLAATVFEHGPEALHPPRASILTQKRWKLPMRG